MQLGRMLGSNTALREVLLGKHGMGDDQLQTLVDYGLGRNAALPITSLDLRCNKLSPMAGPCIKQLLQFTATIQVRPRNLLCRLYVVKRTKAVGGWRP
eukprot:scaffold152576_cov23-Prasinocladus_malaysianus.AAC.1